MAEAAAAPPICEEDPSSPSRLNEEQRHLLASIIDKACESGADCVTPGAIEDVYHCTPVQRSMICGQRDEVLHFVLSLRGSGKNDVGAAVVNQACAALRETVRRNPALRTRIIVCSPATSEKLGLGSGEGSDSSGGDNILQVVLREDHMTEDRRRWPASDGNGDKGNEDLERFLHHDHINKNNDPKGPFGLPLFRSTLIGRSSLVLTMHHAIMDYWSITTLLNVDLPATVLGKGAYLQRPVFKAFVEHALDIDEDAAKDFWRSRFKSSGVSVPATFPEPRRREKRRRSISGSTHGASHPPAPLITAKPSRKISIPRMRDQSVLSSHVPYYVEAAWALAESIYTDSASVAYGYVLSGRSPTPSGVEKTLGPTIAEVPVQVHLQRRTTTVEALIKDRASALRHLQLNARFLHYSHDKISSLSNAARAAVGFQTLFNIRPVVEDSSAADDEAAPVKFDQLSWLGGWFPLQLVFTILDDGVMVWPRVDPAVIGDCRLNRILDQFEHTLSLLMTEKYLHTKLNDLPLLDQSARVEITRWNEAGLDNVTDEKTLAQLFSDQVRMYPQAMAVEAADGSLTYLALDQASTRIAVQLRQNGIAPGMLIGLIFEPSCWVAVAILGVLKAGGACVPIEKDTPHHLMRTVARAAGIQLVLTSPAEKRRTASLVADALIVSSTSVNAESDAATTSAEDEHTTSASTSRDIAYVAFTSGSIGHPKGVVFEHGGLASALTAHARRLGWKPGCRMLQYADIDKGSSILEILGMLLNGGCICIPTEEQRSSLSHIIAFIAFAQVNWAILPPRTLNTLSPGDVPGLQSLLCTGDHVDGVTRSTWGRTALRFYVGWGVCEAAILNTISEVKVGDDEGVEELCNTVGAPVGCAMWIVNPQNSDELAPFGGVGELVVEGPGVSRGYLDNDGKSGETSGLFSSRPRWAHANDAKHRFFRTGELARYALGSHDENSGGICIVGRKGNRVKFGAGTVQLEEVEAAIAGCAEVSDVAVTTKIAVGRTQLVAAVRLVDDDSSLETVRRHALDRLPADHVPTLWSEVPRVPRNGAGKLDRALVRELARSVSG